MSREGTLRLISQACYYRSNRQTLPSYGDTVSPPSADHPGLIVWSLNPFSSPRFALPLMIIPAPYALVIKNASWPAGAFSNVKTPNEVVGFRSGPVAMSFLMKLEYLAKGFGWTPLRRSLSPARAVARAMGFGVRIRMARWRRSWWLSR